jgi:hypothetical protein
MNMANGDVGKKFAFSWYSDKTIQVEGTFAGATVTLRGSCKENPDENTAGDWFNINDAQGLPVAKTAASGSVLLESPLWVSPIVSAGAGATINVYLNGTGA